MSPELQQALVEYIEARDVQSAAWKRLEAATDELKRRVVVRAYETRVFVVGRACVIVRRAPFGGNATAAERTEIDVVGAEFTRDVYEVPEL